PKRLLELAAMARVEVFLDEFQLDRGACVRATIPRPHRLQVCLRGRDLAGERDLDCSLDRGLAGLVGTAHNRETRRESQVQVRVPADVVQVEAGDPHSVTSWPASRR